MRVRSWVRARREGGDVFESLDRLIAEAEANETRTTLQ
jgi:hypothetical protein